MEDTTPPPQMTPAPPSQQRGQKRGRGAQEDSAAATAAAAPRRAAFVETEASWFIRIQEVGQQDDEEEARFANQLIDFLGIHLMDDGDGDTKAGSGEDPFFAGAAPRMGAASRSGDDPAAPPAALDEDGVVRALCNWPLPFFPLRKMPSRGAAVVDGIAAAAAAAAGGNTSAAESADGGGAANTPNANPYGGGPFGFDLNEQLLSPEEEGFLAVPCNAVAVDDGSAAATAGDGGGAVELAASDDEATTVRRPSSGGLDFDLNEPACPSELFPDRSPDPSDVPEPAAPAPAEDSVAEPDADERPELPDGGGAPVSRTRRRRHLRLCDWAFEWASGLEEKPEVKHRRKSHTRGDASTSPDVKHNPSYLPHLGS